MSKNSIFITGITGTLGVSFTEYLTSLGYSVKGIDHNEERVAAFKKTYPDVAIKLGDFGDVDFSIDRPDILLHLAAFKHIDLAETNPSACISNNVIKSYNLLQNAYRNGARIIFMSTDKAVEPTSVYGYSKALIEKMAIELGGAFIRSGNILASNGSVIDVWDKAIAENQPLKLTHKDMRRYFITPEKLAERAWDLYLAGEKEIIPVMDMDITLYELAEQRLGYSLDKYAPGVEYIGLRPGEKLKERLRWDE